MKSPSSPEVIELDIEQLEHHLQQIEQSLGQDTARPFRLLIQWYLQLQQLIQLKSLSIARLRDMLFGAKTERTRDAAAENPSDAAAEHPSDASTTPAATATDTANMADHADPADATTEAANREIDRYYERNERRVTAR